MRARQTRNEPRVLRWELFECFRKLAIVGLPVFFEPGSSEQLTFGLLICCLTLACKSTLNRLQSRVLLYRVFLVETGFAKYSPNRDPDDDTLQLMCLIEVFVALLSTIVLRYEIAFPAYAVAPALPSHHSRPAIPSPLAPRLGGFLPHCDTPRA